MFAINLKLGNSVEVGSAALLQVLLARMLVAVMSVRYAVVTSNSN